MQIYLPIAEMTVPAEAIVALGGIVGFLSGVFGVGGGFLSTPFLIFMGLPPGIAVGTQSSQLVAAGTTGVLGYWKRGNVDARMGGVMLGGSITGSFIGVLVFRLLQHTGQIDVVIPILYVLLLGSMGCIMLAESLRSAMKVSKGKEAKRFRLYHHPLLRGLPYKVKFPRSQVYVSALVPAGIGFISGLLVSIMGIGGGFLLVPAMIYILGMPTMLVAGTALFQMMLTALITGVLHAVTNHSVDLVLAVLLILGSVIGAQVGVRLARKVSGVYARLILAAILLVVSIQLAGDLLIRPAELYITEVR